MSELRPPPEHENKLLHWVRLDPEYRLGTTSSDVNAIPYYEPQVWQWRWLDETWHFFMFDALDGYSSPTATRDAYAAGYRYLGPAEWKRKPDWSGITREVCG